MPIRWKALPVADALDRVEAILEEVKPRIAEAREEVKRAMEGENLAGYVCERLSGLRRELGDAVDRPTHRLGRARESLPQEALEAERRLAGIAEQQTMTV